jgi:hypothetical protein
VEVIDVGQVSGVGSRSPLIEVRFPDSLAHGSELFDAGELMPDKETIAEST